MNRLITLGLGLGLCLPVAGYAADDQPPFVPDRLLVRFEPLGPAEAAYPLLDQVLQLEPLLPVSAKRLADPQRDGAHQVFIARTRPGADLIEAARALTAHPGVRYAEPDYIVHASDTFPNDPDFTQTWGLHNTGQTGGVSDADIDAPAAWDVTTGSSNVIVGVIDTGVDYTHPDLVSNMWVNPGESGSGFETDGIDNDGNGYVDDVYGFDFVLDQPDPADANRHGTHVAGTIGAVGDDGYGVSGVNWDVNIMALRFLSASGSGSTSNAVEALHYAIDNGAHLTNNSWGGGGFSQTLHDALVASRDAGIPFICAGGNAARDIEESPYYPAGYDVASVIPVASTDAADELSGFSNWGASTVLLGAPGSDVLSSVPAFENLFHEDFQGATPPATGSFTMTGAANAWGTLDDGSSGIVARGDWQSAWPYNADADGWLVTPPMDTRGLRGLSLSFSYRYEIDPSDAFSVEVWNGSAWIRVFTRNNTANFRSYFFSTRIDLAQYRNEFMQVRFGWHTGGTDNDAYGIEIDNVALRHIGTDYSTAHVELSGTSMASPHVAGVAALILANEPGLCLEGIRQRLLWTGDEIPSLTGLVASGRRLNAASAVAGPAPTAIASPNGGEVWRHDSERVVFWSSPGCGTVNLSLLKGGTVVMPIATGVPDTGSYRWMVPDTLVEGTDYAVRIDRAGTIDDSDADFTVRPPRVYHVDAGALPGGDGTSWSTAFTTLQEAIDSAVSEDRIWVAEGVYTPVIERIPGDPRSASFELQRRISWYGGFPTGGGDATFEARDPALFRSILSGDLGRDDEAGFVNVEENAYHTVVGLTTDTRTELDGFVITGGNATGPDFYEEAGAGLYLRFASASVRNCVVEGNLGRTGVGIYNESGDSIYSNCVIRDNHATGNAGAMYIWSNGGSADVLLEDCVFEDNTCDVAGGAIYNLLADSLVVRTVFRNNTTAGGWNGGAFENNSGSPTFVSCEFEGNNAGTGGALGNFHADAILINCLLHANTARFGGAVHTHNGRTTMINCTVTENVTTSQGGAAYVYNTELELVNSILWNNFTNGVSDETSQFFLLENGLVTASHTTIEGWTGSFGGVGNTGTDPLFVDPSTRNFTLGAGSGAIDAGDNAGVSDDLGDLDGDDDFSEALPLDFAGDARFRDDPATSDTGSGASPVVDMGAFEMQPPDCVADWNGDGLVNTSDFLAYLNDYNRVSAGNPPVFGDPDLASPTGVLNTSDFLAFLNLFTAGC